MDKHERIILLSRFQSILNYVAWDDLNLKNLEPLRTEVNQEIHEITGKTGIKCPECGGALFEMKKGLHECENCGKEFEDWELEEASDEPQN